MADSAAERVRRSRAHRRGDHSLCRPGRCPEVPAAAPVELVLPAGADVVTATRVEIGTLPAGVRSSPLAASALLLAGQLAQASPREVAGVNRELRATLAELRAAAEAAPEEVDPVDELAERRRRRRGAEVPAPAVVEQQRR